VAIIVAELATQPFAVSESGWGEFEVGITVFLLDKAADPIHVVHRLKLYPPPGIQPCMEKPVVDEVYDEIVFNALPKDPVVAASLLRGSPRLQPVEWHARFHVMSLQGPLGSPLCTPIKSFLGSSTLTRNS
jgi:hypothetical protein